MDNGSPFEEARIAIAEACKRHGVTAGIHATSALVEKHAKAGYQMITVSSDTGSIAAGAARDLKAARDQAPQGQPLYQ